MWIAENVFERDPMNARICINRNGEQKGEPQYHWGYPLGHSRAPHYTKDMTFAWLIMENMKERIIYKYPVMPNIVYHWSDELWHCEFFSGDWMRTATAKTAELAICLAAIIALNGNVEEIVND